MNFDQLMDSSLCKQCQYVSSHGILHSCDVQIRTLSQVIEENLSFPTIFSTIVVMHVKADLLKIFFKRVHAGELKRRIILVSGDEDTTIPYDIFYSCGQMKEFLDNNTNIVKWFAQNYLAGEPFLHSKINYIPIGLDYHSLNAPWMDQTKDALKQEHQLNDVRKKYASVLNNRRLKIYSTFHFQINRRYARLDRAAAIEEIPADLIYYEPTPISRLMSWIKQCDYAFVACPHGNGLDTHRFWEALLLGCVPIIKSSGLDRLFDNLPVLIVNAWSDITDKLLRDTVVRIVARSKDERIRGDDKLLLSYWKKRIYEC